MVFLLKNHDIHRLIWILIMMIIAIICWLMWWTGGLIVAPRKERLIVIIGGWQFVIFLYCIFFVTTKFSLAIINYVFPLLFSLAGFCWRFYKTHEKIMLLGITSLILVIVTSVFHFFKIAIHPKYFTHNSLYHVMQCVNFFILFKFASKLCKNNQAV